MSGSRLDTLVSVLTDATEDICNALQLDRLRTFLSEPKPVQLGWPALRLGDLEVPVPIVQGGMGVGISLSGLAAAVANAGGVGVIAANGIGLIEKDYYSDGRAANIRALRREIQAARAKTDGIIGVNIMVAVNDFHQLLDVAIEEQVDIVFMGAGLPIKGLPVERMRAAGVRAVPIVSSLRAAEMIFRMWKKIYADVPDAVVFEGPLAGGHLGFAKDQLSDPEVQLEVVVPTIVDALKPYEAEFSRRIPVIAGGGVFTGEDIHKVLSLGAGAVQMATRFVATEECDADDAFKQAYINCTEEDIGLIDSPVGMPGRAIRNDFIRAAEAGTRPKFRCAWQCLASCKADSANYCISIALNNARQGRLKQGFVFAGANAYRVQSIVAVSDLVAELAQGYLEAAREYVANRLGQTTETIATLRGGYESVRAQVQELRDRYEKALEARIRTARDSGVETIQRQYEETLSALRHLQLQTADAVAESWSVLRMRARPQ